MKYGGNVVYTSMMYMGQGFFKYKPMWKHQQDLKTPFGMIMALGCEGGAAGFGSELRSRETTDGLVLFGILVQHPIVKLLHIIPILCIARPPSIFLYHGVLGRSLSHLGVHENGEPKKSSKTSASRKLIGFCCPIPRHPSSGETLHVTIGRRNCCFCEQQVFNMGVIWFCSSINSIKHQLSLTCTVYICIYRFLPI